MMLNINREGMDTVSNFRFWVHILFDIEWLINLLVSFHPCTIESVFSSGTVMRYGNGTAMDKKALQKAIESAPKITNIQLFWWGNRTHEDA